MHGTLSETSSTLLDVQESIPIEYSSRYSALAANLMSSETKTNETRDPIYNWTGNTRLNRQGLLT